MSTEEEELDKFGHNWTDGWEDSDTPHPGFGTYGGYVAQCSKCSIYVYECYTTNPNFPAKYENQICGIKVR